jgi:hypothetical protein
VLNALKRHINAVTTQNPSKDKFKSEQRKNKFYCTWAISKLRENWKHFTGVIYWRRAEKHVLLIPASQTRAIIALNHDQITAAHVQHMTLELLCLSNYWLARNEGGRAGHKWKKNILPQNFMTPSHKIRIGSQALQTLMT